MTRLRYLVPLIGAAAAATIFAAPPAMADDSAGSCTTGADDTVCESPGNAQIDATPPDVSSTTPYDDSAPGSYDTSAHTGMG
jgi:hypothetical protein